MTANFRRVHIRWMIRRDFPEILDIEAGGLNQWREEDFVRCLRHRNCIGMVAEIGEKVVGFMIYELHKTRLELVALAVHPNWRRRNVGEQLVAKLVSKLSSHRTKIAVDVPEDRLDAQLFFRSQHFLATKICGDAYRMERWCGDVGDDDKPATYGRFAPTDATEHD